MNDIIFSAEEAARYIAAHGIALHPSELGTSGLYIRERLDAFIEMKRTGPGEYPSEIRVTEHHNQM